LKPDYIYISHVHPDHFDPDTLRYYPKDTEIWVAARGLGSKVRALGFLNVRELRLEETEVIEGLQVTAFGSFDKTSLGLQDHVEHSIDTALLVRDGKTSFLNSNDNPIRPEDAKRISETYGPPTVALIPCGAASLYPMAMKDYSHGEKAAAANRVKVALLGRFLAVCKALKTTSIIPATGSYALGGPLSHLSEYLPIPTPDEVQNAFEGCKGLNSRRLIQLFERDVFIPHGAYGNTYRDWKSKRWTLQDRVDYSQTIRTWVVGSFDYQRMLFDPFKIPWEHLCRLAEANLKAYKNRAYIYENVLVTLVTDEISYTFSLGEVQGFLVPCSKITFHLDSRLLLMVLLGAVSWNNIEIGCHLQVQRTPDTYNPTVHSLMNFFKI
jgi:UDP-MurNAc hydroxylase